jgi:hypothetical protein
MPRLSVDLDLVFADHSLARALALRRINEAIRESVARLRRKGSRRMRRPSRSPGKPSYWCGMARSK